MAVATLTRLLLNKDPCISHWKIAPFVVPKRSRAEWVTGQAHFPDGAEGVREVCAQWRAPHALLFSPFHNVAVTRNTLFRVLTF